MSTAAPTHRPINLKNIAWTEHGRQAMYAAANPGFGVEVIATGELVASKDGTRPAVWSRKSIAQTIAEYPPAFPTITVRKVGA